MMIKILSNITRDISLIIKGASVAIDFSGSLSHQKISQIVNKTEEESLRRDWIKVGADLSKSIEKGKEIYVR